MRNELLPCAIKYDNECNPVGAYIEDNMGRRYEIQMQAVAKELEAFVGRPVTPKLEKEVENVIRKSLQSTALQTGAVSVDLPVSDIWVGWNGVQVGSGTSTTNTNSIWSGWTDPSTSGSVTYSEEVWFRWIVDTTGTSASSGRLGGIIPLHQSYNEISNEERARRQLIAEQENRRREEERARIAVANSKAEELLKFLLDDVQKQSLIEEDWFLVVGKSGTIYRLRRGRVGNIDIVDPSGKVVRTLCTHPGPQLPNSDDLLIQKMHLEDDDEYVRRTANIHRDYHESNCEVIDISKHLRLVA